MLKRSILAAVLLSTVLSSTLSQAYFGESVINGAYDKASSAVSWVKENPGKTITAVAALGVVSYGAYLGYQHYDYLCQKNIEEAKKELKIRSEKEIKDCEFYKGVNNKELNNNVFCLLEKEKKEAFRWVLSDHNTKILNFSERKNIPYGRLADYLEGTGVTDLNLIDTGLNSEDFISDEVKVEGFKDLLKLKQLKALNLADNKIDNEFLDKTDFIDLLAKSSLKELNLEGNKIDLNEGFGASLMKIFKDNDFDAFYLYGNNCNKLCKDSYSVNFENGFDEKNFSFQKPAPVTPE